MFVLQSRSNVEGLNQFNGGPISLAQSRALTLVQAQAMAMVWHFKLAPTKSGGAL